MYKKRDEYTTCNWKLLWSNDMKSTKKNLLYRHCVDHHIEIDNHDKDCSNVDLHETAIFQFPMPSGNAVKRPLKKQEAAVKLA